MNDLVPLVLFLVCAIAIGLAVRLASVRSDLRNAKDGINRLSSEIQQRAMALFDGWREKEYENVKRQQSELAVREATTRLDQWKIETEGSIRDDAVLRSRSVTVGKFAEHFTPCLPGFPYNPKDARFLGSPVDFVVFDGLDLGQLKEIAFVEVKSGGASLTARERQVRDAIQSKSVTWREFVVPSETSSVQLSERVSRARSVDETKERMVRDYIRLGVTEDVARRQVAMLHRTIRAVCTSCTRTIELTIQPGDNTTLCPECNQPVTLNVDRGVS